MPCVGSPPDQKKASRRPAASACADSRTPKRATCTAEGAPSATASMRVAFSSVPEPGAPTDTRRSRRSATRSTGEELGTMTCTLLV